MRKQICILLATVFTATGFLGNFAIADAASGNEFVLNYQAAGNINSVNADTNDNSAAQWKIGNTSYGQAAFFQYELPTIPQGEIIVDAQWQGFVTGTSDKFVRFVQYDTSELIDASTATYNSIISSEEYVNTSRDIYSNLRVNTDNGNYDTAVPTNDTVERTRLKIDMTQAVKDAVSNGNTYFTFIAEGTTPYETIQLPKYAYNPKPQLIIKTLEAWAPEVVITAPENNKRMKEDIPFSVSATINAGSNELAEENPVTFSVTDAQGNDVEPTVEMTVEGDDYTWYFAEGLSGGEYKIEITAEDTMGIKTSAHINIEILGIVTKTLNYVSTADGSSETEADALKYNWQINVNNDTAFQYDLSEIPEGVTVQKAVWSFRVNNKIDTQLVFYKILSQETFGKFTKTKSEIPSFSTKVMYSTEDTVETGAVEQTWNGVTAEFFNVDLTDAVNEALGNGERYFGFVVRAVQNRNSVVIGRASDYAPFPSLQITASSYRLPQITGTVHNVQKSTPFEIEIAVEQGDSEVENVNFYLNDSLIPQSQISNDGNQYSIVWQNGIDTSGNYVLKVSAEDAMGDVKVKEFDFKVVGDDESTQLISISKTVSQGNTFNNLPRSTEYNWQIDENSLIAYFAYDLAEYKESGIKQAVWCCPETSYNGNANFYDIISGWDTEAINSGIVPKLAQTPFTSASGVKNVDMTDWVNKLLEKGITTLQFAIRTESGLLEIINSDKKAPVLNITVSDNKRPDILIEMDNYDCLIQNVNNEIGVTVKEDGLVSNITAVLDGVTECYIDGQNGEYSVVIPQISEGLHKLLVCAEDNFGVKTAQELTFYANHEAFSNHYINVNENAAEAGVDIMTGNAALVLAAYKNNVLMQIVIDSEVENGVLNAQMNLESVEGVSFKSYICADTLEFIPIKDTVDYVK